MSAHHCHALQCSNGCPPRWLMCRGCWALVSPATAREVYRTVKLRGPDVDETWAPWWRAQARATAENAVARGIATTEQAAYYLARAAKVADGMEWRARPLPPPLPPRQHADR